MGIRWGWLAVGLVFAATECAGQGTIATVAGSATCCSAVDGVQATSFWLTSADGLAMDKLGNLYIWSISSGKVKKVTPGGLIVTVAGNGTAGYTGDNGPAISAELFPTGSVTGLAVDSAGNLYISDGYNNVVRKVNSAGIITTVAGNGNGGFLGDGGPATSAQLSFPAGIAVDAAGNLYIADASNSRVRKVDTSGRITTVAGNGNVVYSGDNVQATATAVDRPEGVTVDSQGNLYISETSDSRVRKVNPAGIIATVAGLTKKTSGFSGDGGPATVATLAGPCGLAVDALGNLYIADNSNGRVRKVDAAGIITTYAGITGTASTPIGDGGPATSAFLGVPKDLVLDSAGNLYIGGTAAGVSRVRRVAAGTGAGFTASPASLLLSYTTGGAAPAPQSVSIGSTGAALSFTAVASTTSGNWLSVSPVSGTTPATLTVSVNTAGLGAGTYRGQVTLTPGGSGNSPMVYTVSLTVTGAGSPVITAGGIVNATGYQSHLAPDTVFVLFGSNMGPSSLAAGAANYQTNLAGTSITFMPVGGGAPVSAKIVYTFASQVAGLLPSSIAPGNYAVTVSYNSLTSAPQTVTVVARSFGIATSNSGGTGTAQATIGNVNSGLSLTRFTSGSIAFGGYTWTLTPAHPGDTLVLWGTGGGADAANDAGGTSGDQTAAGNFQVLIGGRQIVPLYAGASSGYPGLWQINFTLPPDITPDCFAQVQVSANGELGNIVNVPVAAAGQQACSDSSTPAATLAKLDAGNNVNFGAFAIAELASGSVTQDTASGAVFSFTPAEWITLNSGPQFGACRVYDRTYPVGGRDPGSPSASLDAGAKLPISGPNLTAGFAMGQTASAYGPIYSNSPAVGTWTGGTYNLSGSGGTQVGPFSSSTIFPGGFTVTNFGTITAINRSTPLQLTWSGSNFANVAIVLSTAVVSGSSQHLTTINCTVPGSPGGYTIPAAALAYLSAVPASGSSFGALSVQGVNHGSFTANLVAGGQLDLGTFSANLGVAKNVAVQ